MTDVQWDEFITTNVNNLKSEGMTIYILLKSIGQQSGNVKEKIKNIRELLIIKS